MGKEAIEWQFDECEAGVLKVVPEAPWLFLSTYG